MTAFVQEPCYLRFEILFMSALSIVIITFNEEKNIARCLQSVQSIADEIVVVDSLSTDATKTIAAGFPNVRIIDQAFLGYIEQKNLALSLATHTHVLMLDADEALSDALLESIVAEKQQGFPSAAYAMNRCTHFNGTWIKHGTWYPDTKIRLIRKDAGKWGGINPHDSIVLNQGIRTSKLKGDILHYSYNSMDEVVAQNNRFTTIQAKAMFERGKRSNWFKILFSPLVAFVSGYFFKLGFLDGMNGFFIARAVAYHTFLKYIKLYDLQQKAV